MAARARIWLAYAALIAVTLSINTQSDISLWGFYGMVLAPLVIGLFLPRLSTIPLSVATLLVTGILMAQVYDAFHIGPSDTVTTVFVDAVLVVVSSSIGAYLGWLATGFRPDKSRNSS